MATPPNVVNVKREGETLLVTVQGKHIDDVIGYEARKVAYAERLNHGFEKSGIDTATGTYPVDASQDDEEFKCKGKPLDPNNMKGMIGREKDIEYRNTFRLQQMI